MSTVYRTLCISDKCLIDDDNQFFVKCNDFEPLSRTLITDRVFGAGGHRLSTEVTAVRYVEKLALNHGLYEVELRYNVSSPVHEYESNLRNHIPFLLQYI